MRPFASSEVSFQLETLKSKVPRRAFASASTFVLAKEGLVVTEEHVHHDAAVPVVVRLVVLPHDDLRRNVVGVARLGREELAVREGVGEAHADDLQSIPSHRIFGLEEKALNLRSLWHTPFSLHVEHGRGGVRDTK